MVSYGTMKNPQGRVVLVSVNPEVSKHSVFSISDKYFLACGQLREIEIVYFESLLDNEDQQFNEGLLMIDVEVLLSNFSLDENFLFTLYLNICTQT